MSAWVLGSPWYITHSALTSSIVAIDTIISDVLAVDVPAMNPSIVHFNPITNFSTPCT